MARPRSRVRYRLVGDGRPQVSVSERPIRFGYGDDCELVLDGEDGPAVLFEVHRSEGPLQIATRVPPDELDSYVELAVDGTPLDGPVRAVGPGSRIELVDKVTRRRYELVLDPPSRWRVRLRFLAATVAALSVLGGAYATYVYLELERTRGTLLSAESRLQHTERRVRETSTRLDSAELRVREALGALAAERRAADEALRDELGRRMDTLGADARAALDRLSERDVAAREGLRAELQGDLEALRDEFAARMVESYQRFKSIEGEVLGALAERLEAFEPETARFKRVLAVASEAALFLHTHYVVEFAGGIERQAFDSFGTGFVVDADGLAFTAQHVLFPWRYERELALLTEVGAARVVESETRWAAWATGARVTDAGHDLDALRFEDAWSSANEGRTLRFVYAPPPAMGEELVQTALGVVGLAIPLPGASDVAVLRLAGHQGALAHLSVETGAVTVEPLDELLAVGYPLSRLVGGVAHPQAVRGLVRRLGEGVVEVDVPLHPGFSGAPLLDGDGAVVGMASAIYGSAVYGVAAPRQSLVDALAAARAAEAARSNAAGPVVE